MISIFFLAFLQDDYIDGLESFGRADYAPAIAALTRAIEKDSENSDTYVARGAAYAFSEKLAEAKKDLDRAMRLDPKNKNAKLWMACVVAMEGRFGEDTQFYPFATHDKFESRLRDVTKEYGRPERREAALREFPELAANFADRLLAGAKGLAAVAKKRYDEGKYKEALVCYERILADDADILYYHAYCLLHTGNFIRARAEFTRVLTLQPGWKSAYVGRAICAAKMGDIKRAKSDAESAVKIDPKITVSLELDKLPTSHELNEALLDAVKTEDDAKRLILITGNRRLRHDEWYQDQIKALHDPVELGDFLQTHASIVGERAEPRGPLRYFRMGNENAELTRAEELLGQNTSITALAARASIHIKRGRWLEAEKLLRQGLESGSIRIIELFVEVLEHAASVKQYKAASLRQTTSWEDARYIYYRYPSQAELDQADDLERQAQKLWELARGYLEKAAEKEPYCRAILAWRDGKLDAAREALLESIRAKPEARAYKLLVSVETASKRTIEALEAQCSHINLFETSCTPLLRAVWECVRQTRWETARKLLSRAAQLDPADPRVSAYRGIVAAAEGKSDEASRHFRIALWLSNDEIFKMAVRLLKPEEFELTIPKFTRYELQHEAFASQLPNPNTPPDVVPMNHNIASLVAWTHVASGVSKYGAKKYDEAIQALLPTQQFELINGYGMERIRSPQLHGALWLAKSYLALGKIDEAGKYAAMLPRKRTGSGPSLNPDADLEEQGTRLQAEIAQRKAGLPVERPKIDKAKILKELGLGEDDVVLQAQAEQSLDDIASERIGDPWKQQVAGSLRNIALGRQAVANNFERSKGRNKQLEASLAKYDKTLAALKKAAIERGYPPGEIDKDSDPNGERRRR